MHNLTTRGNEFTFSDGNNEIIVVKSALCCQPPYKRQCLLYEFQPKSTCKNNNLDRSDSKYFRWTTVPLPISNYNLNKNKVEINFLQGNKYYKIITPNQNIIKFYLSGGLEICWRNRDETVIKPDGERTEFFDQKKIEIYLPSGIAYRKCDANEWNKEEFLPNKAKMSVRGDGSYSTLYNQIQQVQRGNTSKYYDYLQITAPDFKVFIKYFSLKYFLKLHRFNTTKVVNLIIPVESVPSSNLQIFLCCDNVIIVKHVLSKDGIYGQKKLDDCLCFSFGMCEHTINCNVFNELI
ncbi:unnamed protein product [Meloidogyne enterolobii]|uniref:Uncharacterized protein n=1 Tax=Meloidogyne enterolobii TaxID=390850 RepID=A0ACB0XRX4_MELEN